MQDLGFWQNQFGVQRAPSVAFLRGPGALPAVFDASNTRRLDVVKLVADNAWQVKPIMALTCVLLLYAAILTVVFLSTA